MARRRCRGVHQLQPELGHVLGPGESSLEMQSGCGENLGTQLPPEL